MYLWGYGVSLYSKDDNGRLRADYVLGVDDDEPQIDVYLVDGD